MQIDGSKECERDFGFVQMSFRNMRMFNAEKRSFVTVNPPNLSHDAKYSFETCTLV